MRPFDTVVVVDWSAASVPSRPRAKDSIWFAAARTGSREAARHRATRAAAMEGLGALAEEEAVAGRRVLMGFDFAMGYPEGAARLIAGTDDPLALWDWMAGELSDAPDNRNDRFELADRINARLPGDGPFWGRPKGRDDLRHLDTLRPKAPPLPPHRAVERRLAARGGPGAQAKSVWQLFYSGAVGGQSIAGMAALARLRRRLGSRVEAWPFGQADEAPVVLAEVYPALIDGAVGEAVKAAKARGEAPVRDEVQVTLLARALLAVQASEGVARLLAAPDPAARREGWILGADLAENLDAAARALDATPSVADASPPRRANPPASPVPASNAGPPDADVQGAGSPPNAATPLPTTAPGARPNAEGFSAAAGGAQATPPGEAGPPGARSPHADRRDRTPAAAAPPLDVAPTLAPSASPAAPGAATRGAEPPPDAATPPPGVEGSHAEAAPPGPAAPPLSDDCFALPPGVDWTPVDAALARLRDGLAPVTGAEAVPVADAGGRVLAEDATARRSSPPGANAAVDGYGFAHAAVVPGDNVMPLVSGRAAAGAPLGRPVPRGSAARILTGALLPEGVDTVILQEDARAEGGRVAFAGPVKPRANTRAAGEDVEKGALALPLGRRLGPPDLALLASLGIAEVRVRARLRVGVLSTGDELAAPGETLDPARTYDANRPMLLALLDRWDHEAVDLGLVPDDRAALRARLDGAGCRAVLCSGGASAGEEDHVSAILRAEGRVTTWRVAMKPGRPLAMGLWRGVPVLGLPGNPVAAFVCALVFARPMLSAMAGSGWVEPQGFELPAGFSKRKKAGRREYLRARVRNGRTEVFASEGSGRVSGLAWAEGLVELGEAAREVRPGELVRYLPYGSFGL